MRFYTIWYPQGTAATILWMVKIPKHGEAGWWILKDWAYITGNNRVQIQIEQIIGYIRSEQLDFRPPATALLPLVDQWNNFDARY